MLKKQLRHYYTKFSSNKYIAKLSKMAGATHLWSFDRASVAKGIAVGIACAWIPLPFHTIMAIALALLIDCNIPLAAIAIWAANPITMPFMYYFAYLVGDFALNIQSLHIKFDLSVHDVMQVLHTVWEPFLLGCLICGVVSGILAYIIVQMFWPRISKNIKSSRPSKRN